MGANFDIFAADASTQARNARNAANANLDASIIAIQMIKEMRDFEARRFNDLVDANNRRAAEIKSLHAKVDNLQSQVAALQKRLYDEEQSKTPLKAVAR